MLPPLYRDLVRIRPNGVWRFVRSQDDSGTDFQEVLDGYHRKDF